MFNDFPANTRISTIGITLVKLSSQITKQQPTAQYNQVIIRQYPEDQSTKTQRQSAVDKQFDKGKS